LLDGLGLPAEKLGVVGRGLLGSTALEFVPGHASHVVDPAGADVVSRLPDAQYGAVRVGEHAALPLHVFPLERTAEAHRAVQEGAVGKVLIDVTA